MIQVRTDRRFGLLGVLFGILGTSLPATFASDARMVVSGTSFVVPASMAAPRIDGDWFVVTGDPTQAHSRPPVASGGYAVLDLAPGTLVFVTDFEGHSARITPQGGASGLCGLLEVDDAVVVEGETVRILQPTDLRAPNLKFSEATGRPNPIRSYDNLMELDGGEVLTVLDRFDSRGRTWLLVQPPIDATVFVRSTEIRPATAKEIAAANNPAGATVALAIETPDVETPEVENPEVETRETPSPLEPRQDDSKANQPAASEDTPAADNRQRSDEVTFPDGVLGVWKQLRADQKSIFTGPDGQANYGFARLDDGDPVCVVEESASTGWCRIRLVGPSLEGVRGLVKTQEGMIEIEGEFATVVRGEHEVRAPNLTGRSVEGDESVDPNRSYLPFARVRPGDTLVLTGRFRDQSGATWLEVIPPLASVGWIHRGYLEEVASDDLPFAVGMDAAGRPRFAHDFLHDNAAPTIAESIVDEARPDEDVETVDAAEIAEVADEAAVAEVEEVVEVAENSDDADHAVELVATPEVDLIENEAESTEPEIVLQPKPEPEPAASLSPEALGSVTLEEAEATYDRIRSSPENDAEFEALDLIYRTIAERPSTSSSDRSRAEIRLSQIHIQRDVQRRIDTLRRLENRASIDRERIEAIREALLDRSDYTAIGRLKRSRVYDGRTLPLLYRLEDPSSGRTIAYVRPNDALSIQSGVGRIVGIVGIERDDPGYRIRIITPERFEIDLTEEIDEN